MEHRRYLNALCKLLVLLHSGGASADAARELSVLTGADVTLGCRFDATPRRLERRSVTVEWNVARGRGAGKRVVLTLEDGVARVARAGAALDDARLLRGDASLLLRDVSVGDEGLYTCRVITPVVYTESTALEVLARPSVTLPERATVTAGEEKTLQCDIAGFYPEKLAVAWQTQGDPRAAPAAVSGRPFHVCTEMAVRRPDGTYSVRSSVTLPSSAVTGGEMRVVCRVEHRSFGGTHGRWVTLTVVAPSHPLHDAAILVSVTLTCLLLIVSVAGGTWLSYRYFRKAPPSVSHISQPSHIYCGVPADLVCTIRGARQRELQVRWFRARGPADPAAPSESDPMAPGEDEDEDEDVSQRASLRSAGGLHASTLTVCLTVAEDGTRYRCVVQCRGRSDGPRIREATVHVKVEPSFLQISSTPQIPEVDRPLVLCCRVENFYPDDVHTEWSRDDGEPAGAPASFGPFPDDRRLYSVWSVARLVVAREDEGAVYTCRVYHSSFPPPGFRDVPYHVNTQGTPPDVMFIGCDPPRPPPGEECTLHLCVRDFCPEDVSVTWTRGGRAVRSGVFNTPPSLNVNGRYSMFSFLKLTPGGGERGSEVTCRVVHGAQGEPEERRFTLVCAPQQRVSAVEMDEGGPSITRSGPVGAARLRDDGLDDLRI